MSWNEGLSNDQMIYDWYIMGSIFASKWKWTCYYKWNPVPLVLYISKWFSGTTVSPLYIMASTKLEMVNGIRKC